MNFSSWGEQKDRIRYLYKKTNVMQNITLQSKYRVITSQILEAGEK